MAWQLEALGQEERGRQGHRGEAWSLGLTASRWDPGSMSTASRLPARGSAVWLPRLSRVNQCCQHAAGSDTEQAGPPDASLRAPAARAQGAGRHSRMEMVMQRLTSYSQVFTCGHSKVLMVAHS